MTMPNYIAPLSNQFAGTRCTRTDMKAPLLIFCSLLLTAVAICGTLEARTSLIPDDVKVLHQENVVGPIDIDFMATCGRDGRVTGQVQQRCHDQHIVRASTSP